MQQRLAWMATLIIVFTMSLVSFLNYSNYYKNYNELTRSRYLVSVNDIKQAIESALNLGLPLGQLEQVQQLLDEFKARETNVLFVRVVDEHGNIAFTSERALEDKQIELVSFQSNAGIKKDGLWQEKDAEVYLVEMALENNFNVKVGAVRMGFSRVQFDSKVAGMRHSLVIDTIGVVGIALLMMVVGIRVIMHAVEPDISYVECSLDQFLANPGSATNAISEAGSELAHDIAEFERATRVALHDIELVSSGELNRRSEGEESHRSVA